MAGHKDDAPSASDEYIWGLESHVRWLQTSLTGRRNALSQLAGFLEDSAPTFGRSGRRMRRYAEWLREEAQRCQADLDYVPPGFR